MVNPINYVLGGADPVQQLFQGVEFGVGLRQKEQGLRQGEQQMEINAAQEARNAEMQPLRVQQAELGLDQTRANIQRQQQQLAAADRELARQEAFQQSMGHLAELGPNATLQDYQRVGAAFPEFGAAINETWDQLDENRKAGVQTRLMQIGAALKAGAVDTAIKLGEEYAEAAANSGDEAAAATARAMVESIKVDPSTGLASLGLTLSSIDPDGAGNLFSTAKVQSSEIIEGRVAVQQMNDGSVRVIDTATGQQLQGQAAQDAIRAAEAAGIEAQGARAGVRESAKIEERVLGGENVKAAESLGAQRGQIIKDTGETISNVTSSLRNYDRAIRAIDDGAKAGVIYNRLPNITQQSAELKNALDSLGLDVIGSVTFGALSEGELNLAMETAAPRNLNSDELRAWLSERQEAQRKIRESLLEMQVFLSDPRNNLQDWYKQIQDATDAEETANPLDGGALDDSAFKAMLMAKHSRGEQITPEERQRLIEIADRETGNR